MGRVFPVVVLCLGLTAPLAADGWEPLSEDETAIQFNAPGLAGIPKTFLTNSDLEGQRLELAVWADSGSGFPKALVQYNDLDASHYLLGSDDFDAFLDAQLASKDVAVNWGEEGSTRNAQGKIAYKMFEAGGSQCGSFIQYWGSGSFYQGGYDKSFSGYYCSDPGRPLSRQEFVTALKSLKDIIPAKWSEGAP